MKYRTNNLSFFLKKVYTGNQCFDEFFFFNIWCVVGVERSNASDSSSSALDSSSGVVRMQVRIPAWPVAALVSLSKTLHHNCFGWDVTP